MVQNPQIDCRKQLVALCSGEKIGRHRDRRVAVAQPDQDLVPIRQLGILERDDRLSVQDELIGLQGFAQGADDEYVAVPLNDARVVACVDFNAAPPSILGSLTRSLSCRQPAPNHQATPRVP
jgi:hypothetical protein